MTRGAGGALAAVLIAWIAGGCGGSTHRSRAETRSGTPHAVTTAPYRWLIAPAGAQPSVAAENQHRGTGAWRLPGPRRYVGGLRGGDVVGYVSEQSVAPGQTERIYVSA